MIHRDLKPANLSCWLPTSSPKITDFGLAKKLDEVGQTATGDIMGTPSYMAPEQAGMASPGRRPGDSAVGPACDIYALGAILYELLTGRPPFKAATHLDTILQVINDEPAPPRQVQSKIPVDVETICLKCLQKEPTKRYSTALKLAEDLQRFQEGLPVLARPVRRMERGWRWCKRNPVVAGLTATVAVTLLLGAGVGTGLAAWALVEKGRADEEAARTRVERDRAEDEKAKKEEQLGRAEWALYRNQITPGPGGMGAWQPDIGVGPFASVFAKVTRLGT